VQTTEALRCDRVGRVALLALRRPERLNAFDNALHDALMEALDAIDADDDVRAVVLTGTGPAFCSGMDLDDFRWEAPGLNARLDELQWFGRQTVALAELDKPTIAAVNGIAAGLGMSIALACDLRVGCTATRFRTVFVERGFTPDSGLTWTLPRVVGYSRAVDLLTTSREIGPDEAFRIGLLDRLVDAADPVPDAIALAESIAAQPPLAIRTTKRVLQFALNTDLRGALARELTGQRLALTARHDRAEARRAFVEKRPGDFTGS